MRNLVLDRPVAPAEWVNETRTTGTDLSVEYLTFTSLLADLLQRAGRVGRVSQTSSFHLVTEQYYFRHGSEESTPNPGFWRLHPAAVATLTQTSTDVRALPSGYGSLSPSLVSPALQAADDLREWLHLTYDDIAAMSGLGKRTIHHWRATGAQPRPSTARRLLEIHALVDALRRKLGPDRAGDWFRTGVPSPLQLLKSGDWSSVQEATHDVLFRQPRKERDFAGYSPYDPETDFAVGSQEDRQFRRATRSPRRGRLPQP